MNRHKLLDVGGTFIKCEDGRQVPINSAGTREEISRSLQEAVGGCKPGDSIAIATPGPFDYNNGVFLMKHKFASVYGESFVALAGIPEGVEVRYIHDAACMLLGEITYGAGKGYENVTLVTLGTGLGFTMTQNREIQLNAVGSPSIAIYNRPYRDGMLEDYVSARGLLRCYAEVAAETPGEHPHPGSALEVGLLAGDGNAVALAAFRKMAQILADSIKDLMETFHIECLLFGGQVSKSFRFMEETLRENLTGLKQISVISDFSNATFNGLKALLEEKA